MAANLTTEGSGRYGSSVTARTLWLCPSRGRPVNVAELRLTWALTASSLYDGPDLLVIIDSDDPCRDEYLRHKEPRGSRRQWMRFRVNAEPGQHVAGIVNAAMLANLDGYDAIGFLGDDHRMRTPGWDKLLAESIEAKGTAVIYGDDGHQHEKLPTAVVITTDILRPLGYMCPPGQQHLYLDDFWKRLGTDLGCLTYLPELVIEHCHPHAGKAQWDEGYARVNSPALYEADRIAYERFVDQQWPADLARVRAALNLAAR